jgi:hypothetical protein
MPSSLQIRLSRKQSSEVVDHSPPAHPPGSCRWLRQCSGDTDALLLAAGHWSTRNKGLVGKTYAFKAMQSQLQIFTCSGKKLRQVP